MAPRTRPLMARIWEKIDRSSPEGCWPWGGRTDRDGYGVIYNSGGSQRVTRILLGARIGRDLKRSEVARHTCDTPQCCRPTHLVVGTWAQNSRDMVERRRGTGNRTPHGHGRKITDEQVVELRERYARGESCGGLATAFGISKFHVRNVAAGRFRKTAGGPITRRIIDTEAEEAA